MAHRAEQGRQPSRVGGAVATGLAVLCVVAACAAPTVSLEPKTHAYTPADYESVYKLWTREANPFDFERMESTLRVTATFEARAFRWAYVVRYAQDLGLTVDERSSLMQATLEDADQYHRFFVTMALASQAAEADLTHERSAWRVMLLDDRGRQTLPVQIDRLKRPTPAQRAYFPTATRQRRAMRIAFPVRNERGELTVPEDSLFALLRFTGPKGTVDLIWNFPLDEGRRRRLRERGAGDEAAP